MLTTRPSGVPLLVLDENLGRSMHFQRSIYTDGLRHCGSSGKTEGPRGKGARTRPKRHWRIINRALNDMVHGRSKCKWSWFFSVILRPSVIEFRNYSCTTDYVSYLYNDRRMLWLLIVVKLYLPGTALVRSATAFDSRVYKRLLPLWFFTLPNLTPTSEAQNSTSA